MGELGTLGDVIFTWVRRIGQNTKFDDREILIHMHLRIKVIISGTLKFSCAR